MKLYYLHSIVHIAKVLNEIRYWKGDSTIHNIELIIVVKIAVT